MKICCIAPSRIPSETANSIQAMKACHALAQLGHEVILIVPGSGPAQGEEETWWRDLAWQYGLQKEFKLEYIPPFDGYLARRLFPWRAGFTARRHQPDLVYSWLMPSAVLGLRAGLPVVLEMHDLPIGRFGPVWYRSFLRTKGRKRQLAITQALADALGKESSLPQPETIIAPNGVDLARYAGLPAAAEARARLGLPNRPTAACTGHLYAGRGVELFLDLAARLPEIHFLWVGGRPKDVQRWKNVVVETGLKNVTFQGFVPNAELPLYQAAADVLLLPYQEVVGGSSGAAPVSFFSSMKVYEYMASGRPIISSDLPVIYESLGREQAVFCPPDDADAWTAAIQELLSSPEKAGAYVQAAAGHVKAYSWTARAERALEGWE